MTIADSGPAPAAAPASRWETLGFTPLDNPGTLDVFVEKQLLSKRLPIVGWLVQQDQRTAERRVVPGIFGGEGVVLPLEGFRFLDGAGEPLSAFRCVFNIKLPTTAPTLSSTSSRPPSPSSTGRRPAASCASRKARSPASSSRTTDVAALSEIPAEADERLTPIIEECWSRLDEAQHDAIIDIPTRIDTNGEIHDLVLTLFTTAGAFDVLHLDPASVGLHVLDGELHYVPSDDG